MVRRQLGFTIIELIVVVAIIAILSTIVLMTLGGTAGKADISNGLSFSHTLLHGLGYEAVGVWCFDDGEGINLNDRSGYENDGTWSGSGTHWVDNDISELGIAGYFNGSNDYVAIDGLLYNAKGQIEEITIECWVKTIDDRAAIIDWDRVEYFSLGINFDGKQTAGRISWDTTDEDKDTHDMESSIQINDNKWHHIVASYNSVTGVKVIYIDGQEDVSEQAYSINQRLGTGTVRYGFIGDGSKAPTFDGNRRGRYYAGSIDEVRIYHQVLTSAEIWKYYVEGLERIKLVEK